MEKLFTFNRVSAPTWYIAGKIMRRKTLGRVQLKLFDSTVWFGRRVDRLLPWRGVSVIAFARKP